MQRRRAVGAAELRSTANGEGDSILGKLTYREIQADKDARRETARHRQRQRSKERQTEKGREVDR